MTFLSYEQFAVHVAGLGATQILCKLLAENDNTKQQIFLGGSFEALSHIPYGEVTKDSTPKTPTLKARVDLRWISPDGLPMPAPGTNLILYPRYPEVRLSGFLRGCSNAPAALLQPVEKGERRFNNGPDGRVLFLCPTPEGAVLAYVAKADSALARETLTKVTTSGSEKFGVFYRLSIGTRNARDEILARLIKIHRAGWHSSVRLGRSGTPIPYAARNGAGLTLEALFGIRQNSRSEPDFQGWEIKAHGGSRITLMTPEPTEGYYGEHGTKQFVLKYGKASDATVYFTGIHRADYRCEVTGQTLQLSGFDNETGKITNVDGGIELIDGHGDLAARWPFTALLAHWGRKHASAVYVPYEKSITETAQNLYRFDSPVAMGEGTDFTLFLREVASGSVVLDPGSRIRTIGDRQEVKARNQFRTALKSLPKLYRSFECIPLGRNPDDSDKGTD